MKATQFIKDHGLERAREVVERSASAKWADYYNIATDSLGTAGWGFSEKLCLHNNKYVLLLDIKRLVESVDLVNKFGGFEAAKRKVKMALFNRFLLISFPAESGIGSIYTHKVELAIKDYGSIYGEGNE
jgi:hypothetical protein